MNILWLAATPHPSVVDHPVPWVTTLASNLVAKKNLSITVVSYSPHIAQDDERTLNGVRYVFLKVPRDGRDLLTGYTRRIKRVRNYLATEVNRYDLMHIHGAEQQYHVMGAFAKIPKVLSAQGFVTEYYPFLPPKLEFRHFSWLVAGYYEKKYIPSFNHFICRTHWDKAIIKKLHPKATIHHNWELIRPEFYRAIAPPKSRTNNAILFIGGVNYIKGIREVLQTLDALLPTLPIRLIVTGFGTKQQVLDLAASLSLRNIHPDVIDHRGMLGADAIWHTYHEAFCLLHPSYIDNSPNSVCEAQLAGLPVIASNVGGVGSLVEPGKTGLLTSLKVTELVDAVRELWTNKTLRQNLAGQARAISLERFDSNHITDTTEDIYQKVLTNYSPI